MDLRHIRGLRVDAFTIVRERESSTEIFIRDNKVDEGTESDSTTYSLRFWKGKRTVSGQVDSLDMKDVKPIYKLLAIAPEMKYFHGLPEPKRIPTVEIYDSRLAKLPVSRLVEQAKIARDSIMAKDVDAGFGVISRGVGEWDLVTSEGVETSYRSTGFSASVSATAKLSGMKASAWESLEDTKFRPVSGIAKVARNKSREQLRQRSVTRLPSSVVLEPKVVSQLLHYAMLPNLKMNSVEDRRSLYERSLGKRIWGNVSLVDDPTIGGGTSSYPVDWEGSPAERTMLVEDGTLKAFISDHNTAVQMKMPASPNAGESGIEFSNIRLDGTHTDVRNVVFVGDVIGAHTAEPFSGRFSVMAEGASLVRGGKRIPLKPFMLSGSMDAVLKGCMFTGKRENRNSIYTRSIVTKDISVVRI